MRKKDSIEETKPSWHAANAGLVQSMLENCLFGLQAKMNFNTGTCLIMAHILITFKGVKSILPKI